VDGIIDGVGAVLGFLPLIMVLFCFLAGICLCCFLFYDYLHTDEQTKKNDPGNCSKKPEGGTVMKGFDWMVLAAVVLIVSLALLKIRKDKKGGAPCAGCSSCPVKGSCEKLS